MRDYNSHSKSHLLITYYVPGTVLGTLQPTSKYRWGNSSGRLLMLTFDAEVNKTPVRYD